MIKLETRKNLTKSPLLINSCSKYINPLKEVKHAQNPLNKIFLLNFLTFFAITKPNKNEPIKEIRILLLINNLRKVANVANR